MSIASALKTRLPGGVMFNNLYKFSLSKISKDNPLEVALFTKKKLVLQNFFLGCEEERHLEYYKYLYKTLCDLFTDTSNKDFFDFKGAKVPKAISDKDLITFAQEAVDLLTFDLLDNNTLCEAASTEGPYERGKVRVSAGDVVIDCGANMGVFSAVASNKGGTIYAFEPSDYIIKNYLSKTAEFNKNIHICKYALSDKREELNFEFNDKDIGAGRLSIVKNEQSGVQPQSVQAISLDEFVEENKVCKVDFIKADIEGAERFLLKGAKQTLKEFAPKLSICTYHLPDDPKILREIILAANPNYIIEEKFQKLYAHVPQKTA